MNKWDRVNAAAEYGIVAPARADGRLVVADFGTILSVGGSLLGAAMQSDSAESAASTQAASTDAATGEQRRHFNLIREDQSPYRAAGASALARLRGLVGLSRPGVVYGNQILDPNTMEVIGTTSDQPGRTTPQAVAAAAPGLGLSKVLDSSGNTYWEPAPGASDDGALTRKFTIEDFWSDPVVKLGYQTGLDLGTKALRNAAPLTTGIDSGAALKELTKFGTDYTGLKAGESEQRFEGNRTNVFNKLMGLIGGGQVANQATGNAGMMSASNIGNLQTAGANAQGAARIAGANAWSGAMGNLSNWWQQNQMLDKVLKRNGSTPFNPFYTGFGAGGDYQYG